MVIPPATLTTTVIFFTFFSVVTTTVNLQTFSISYNTFNKSFAGKTNSDLVFQNNAGIANDAVQVTPSTHNTAVYGLQNQSGRAMYRKSFKLWNAGNSSGNNSTIASFNTSFLINISPVPENSTAGEGLAFLIAPTFEIPGNSHGQYLGLTNATVDNQTTNGVVAVELDTVKQDHDIDDNHIGVNIHTIKSVVAESLTPHNITLAQRLSPAFHNIWVNYDGAGKTLRVYIATQPTQFSPTPAMPTTPIIEHELDLRGIVNQHSYFGFSGSTGNFTELNSILRWNLTVTYFPGPESTPWLKMLLGVGIPAMVVVLMALAVMVGYYLYKKRLVERSPENILFRLKSLPGMAREFGFRELKKATNDFEEKRKLGEGGYGVVYRGILEPENVEVAVKQFRRESLKGEGDFLAELSIINRLRHKHLVRLLGWCYKNQKLLLVYEYMPKGSLDMHLFTQKGERLNWTLRYNILAGVASALHYLHHEYDQKVIHRDIKASNIMLDSNFNARLGDFGLARALENEKTSYAEPEGMPGTMGYIAPECFHTGKATRQSDIYAFGALLIEVVSGRRPGMRVNGFKFLVDYVWSLYRDGCVLDAVDKRLGDDYDDVKAERVLLLGLACSHPIASERPNTEAILEMLSGSVVVPPIPPFKPDFVWPSMPPSIDDLSLAITIKMKHVTV